MMWPHDVQAGRQVTAAETGMHEDGDSVGSIVAVVLRAANLAVECTNAMQARMTMHVRVYPAVQMKWATANLRGVQPASMMMMPRACAHHIPRTGAMVP